MSKFGDTMQLVKKARAIQKELRETEIEATSRDGLITVVFNGEQHVKSLTIDESMLTPEHKQELERSLINVVGQAISQSQAVAAERMKEVAGDLKIPGLGG